MHFPGKRARLDSLGAYVANHIHHMHYVKRLGEGRSIGSGPVEGACKNLIDRRLKQTGARWKVRPLNRMAGLYSIMYSDLWTTNWNAASTNPPESAAAPPAHGILRLTC